MSDRKIPEQEPGESYADYRERLQEHGEADRCERCSAEILKQTKADEGAIEAYKQRILEMHTTECHLWRQAQALHASGDTFTAIVEKMLGYEVHKTVPFLNAVPVVDPVDEVAGMVLAELHSAMADHPKWHSAHEGYAVILEELDELKAWVWMKQKNRDLDKMRKEAIQVAATAMRFVLDICPPEKPGDGQ